MRHFVFYKYYKAKLQIMVAKINNLDKKKHLLEEYDKLYQYFLIILKNAS